MSIKHLNVNKALFSNLSKQKYLGVLSNKSFNLIFNYFKYAYDFTFVNDVFF